MDSSEEEEKSVRCSYCGTENQSGHTECRNCGRVLSLEQQTKKEEKQQVIERLAELDEKGILEKLAKAEGFDQ